MLFREPAQFSKAHFVREKDYPIEPPYLVGRAQYSVDRVVALSFRALVTAHVCLHDVRSCYWFFV